VIVLILLGGYLSIRGYHSRDGDQAYRLPLLLHRQDPGLFAGDPFVRAFDAFNPHHGYLSLLDLASRPAGLSAGLFVLFAATFVVTCLGIERLARSTWPGSCGRVGWLAAVLVLATEAGNIGTNHLFEPVLLDRLMALALGWTALAAWVAGPSSHAWIAPPLLGLAAWIHPSLGLQLALLLGAALVVGVVLGGRAGITPGGAITGLILLGVGLIPATWGMAGQAGRLLAGRPVEEFRQLALYVQGPQHMVPHLWRMPQWLAWAGFPALAALSLVARPERVGCSASNPRVSEEFDLLPRSRVRLILLLAVGLSGLAVAWFLVEVVGLLRVTIFQPFRTATVARGLCLVLIARHVLRLWERGDLAGRLRAAILFAGLAGDWVMVVATAIELVSAAAERRAGDRTAAAALGIALAPGVAFLVRHDPQWGYVPLVGSLGLGLLVTLLGRGRPWPLDRGRCLRLVVLAWVMPGLALLAQVAPGTLPATAGRAATALTAHCRFGETPIDDIERLALWCRAHTPPAARFVGPPGPKAFRLWSRRELAFNRAASPYHAVGLADWAERFRAHVGFRGTAAEFARAYLADRQGLERRYAELDDPALASLARRQGATFVVAGADRGGSGPLCKLHQEGRSAVYAVVDGAAGGRLARRGNGPDPR
jgi:hypothetical protein